MCGTLVLLRHFVCGNPTWNRGVGNTRETYVGREFIGPNPRKARGLGTPRGRRVEFTV